jgi:hypothetical protein
VISSELSWREIDYLRSFVFQFGNGMAFWSSSYLLDSTFCLLDSVTLCVVKCMFAKSIKFRRKKIYIHNLSIAE